MKRMCAWCGRELDQVQPRDQQSQTHGVCPACRRQFFSPTPLGDRPHSTDDGHDEGPDPPDSGQGSRPGAS